MRGAIFDMDGVLVDSERLFQRCWHDLAREHGVVLPSSFAAEITGSSAALTRRIVEKYWPGADPDEIAKTCFERVIVIEETQLVPKAGAAELLQALSSSGWKLAVASSSPRDMVQRNLALTGLASYFQEVLSREDILRGKPFPDIFLLAAKRLALAPEDCLVLEDSINGLHAARDAGCIPVMVPDQVPPNQELRAFCKVYPSLVEVLADIRSGRL